MKENTITKLLFWLAFAAFLGGSIPHVAYVFHFFEFQKNGSSIDNNVGWIISYALAGSIDVLVLWLSFIQSKGKMTDKSIIWFFILSLSLMSWYCNWLYDMSHNTSTISSIWEQNVLGSKYTFSQVTAIIVSAIPMFILAYTFMISKVANSNMTASELQQTADDLEQKQTQLRRINQLRQKAKTEKAASFVQNIKNLRRNVKEAISSPVEETPLEETPLENTTVKEHNTDELTAIANLDAAIEDVEINQIIPSVPDDLQKFLLEVHSTK